MCIFVNKYSWVVKSLAVTNKHSWVFTATALGLQISPPRSSSLRSLNVVKRSMAGRFC